MSAIIQSELAISDMKLPFTSRPITLGLVLLAISCSPLIIDQAVSSMEHLIGKIKSLSRPMEVDGTTTASSDAAPRGTISVFGLSAGPECWPDSGNHDAR